MITEPLPLVVVLSVVPKTASTYWSRDMRRLFVAFVPLRSPSHCRNDHPGAGTISREAQWFEDHSPIADAHKKKDVVGISAKVIAVLGEVGDSAPVTPVGINFPNADWIREKYGSKSVMAGNIMAAYNYVKARSPAPKSLLRLLKSRRASRNTVPSRPTCTWTCMKSLVMPRAKSIPVWPRRTKL